MPKTRSNYNQPSWLGRTDHCSKRTRNAQNYLETKIESPPDTSVLSLFSSRAFSLTDIPHPCSQLSSQSFVLVNNFPVATIATLKFGAGFATSNASAGKRCVMLVADPGRETISALEWALSHAFVENDEVILLHVEPATGAGLRRGTSSSSFGFLKRTSTGTGEVDGKVVDGEYEFLATMKAMCQARHPTVPVNIETVEMDERVDKATMILAEANRRNVDMIIIGQRRSSFLGSKLSGSIANKGPDLPEFLIEQSKCLCVAVQKKHSAGYVLNTKTHKNFWLLA
ncbi:Adenine nucleotide alpha hydrolases-like superfamily protein [Rhynchospora pubera]|uniref:Adenine nucleotide alpha hydrolases-like superfamily protein n=1 Tax=Rhynchospora pubera TaxID=906938 RepID=A0AAV8E8Y4_9POAL|nr:Adenine nucleotide alpha hydrolases-like superfamily protein [Rhynchospora pubera]